MKSRGLQESFLKEVMPELSLEETVRITLVTEDGEVRHDLPQAKTWRIEQCVVCQELLGPQCHTVVFIDNSEICHKEFDINNIYQNVQILTFPVN